MFKLSSLWILRRLMVFVMAIVGPYLRKDREVSMPTEIIVLDNEFQIIHHIRDKNKLSQTWNILNNSKPIDILTYINWTH